MSRRREAIPLQRLAPEAQPLLPRPARSQRAGRASGYRSAPMQRVRLDSLLAERGLFESRSRAAAAVLAGAVQELDSEQRGAFPRN